MSLRRQLDYLCCAVQFLTRLPTPRLDGFHSEWIARSARYFPLVGQLVGALGAAALLVSAKLWSGPLPALVALAVTVLVSGAFHEDGLADSCDGLGGGQTPERRLEIMKDSRVGTYGAVALILTFGLRGLGLANLGWTEAAAALLAAQGLGRTAAVIGMRLPYAGDPSTAKEGRPGAPTRAELAVAVLIGLWPLVLLPFWAALIACAGGALLACAPALAAWRLIRGRTGDVLGAIEQAFEIGFILALTAALR